VRARLDKIGLKKISGDYVSYSKFLMKLANSFNQLNMLNGILIVTRTYYYDAIIRVEDGASEHLKQKEFFENLQNQMYMSEVKLGDQVKTEDGLKQKGVDTLIAIDMIIKAYLNQYDVACLIAGDRDFVNVVRAVKDFTGKMVFGVYVTENTAPELIRVFDFKKSISNEELASLIAT